MIKIFEEKLFSKTRDTQSDILYAQWTYDKKLISAALQSISSLFPHFSLHDESHSISILNNIIRVIGSENIDKLTSIDIWLILEASYYHDIGMVISSDRLINAIKSEEFLDFLKGLINDKKSALFDSANLFEITGNKIKFKNDYFDFETYDGIKFILAEFFRKSHSTRSKDIITNPLDEISLRSPRGIIPQRIFNFLGDICACHTKEFSEVMKLSFCEVGIDTEDAHPRYVASLLRIGDLLDLDNNRFSEVILRTLSKIPIDTLTHKSKHFSIESFRADKTLIEIKAKCKDYDTANITQHWLNYLNSEITNQMINWNKIVPNKDLGYLPTIGSLRVELTNYDFIDGKNKPKFTVDTDRALDLLQGAGLYDGDYQCIREILQNSVDASLLRMWLEYKNDQTFESPHCQSFIDLTKYFPISIQIIHVGVDTEWQNWKIIIEDKGTGISKDDLKFLMNTGSSSKNKERTKIIESMPPWMRPSGTFGIGLQSIFMLTDLVKIETKSFIDEIYQEIELNSPSSRKDGDILIKRKKTTHAVKPGTKLVFNYRTKAIPASYTIHAEHRNASRIAHNYDPFKHESLDIELGKIFDEIFDFANKSYFPISLKVDSESIDTAPLNKSSFNYFDPDTSLELNILAERKEDRFRTRTYYKNQIAENNLSLDFLGFEINIHQEKASEVLTLNRNKIKPDFHEKLINQLFNSSFKIITQNFDSIFDTDDKKSLGSMFLNYYHNQVEAKKFDIKQFNHWENLKINVGDKAIIMKDLLKKINTLKLIYNNDIKANLRDTYTLDKKNLQIHILGQHPSFDYTKFFLIKASEYFTCATKLDTSNPNVKEILFEKKVQSSPITQESLIGILKSHKVGYPYSARIFIPCIDKYFNLRLKDDSHESYVYHYFIDSNVTIPFPKMLSPYIRELQKDGKNNILRLEINDKLLDWVYKNRFNPSTTKDQIKIAYDEFIKEFDLNEINK